MMRSRLARMKFVIIERIPAGLVAVAALPPVGPVIANAIITEGGDTITTENGDPMTTEN